MRSGLLSFARVEMAARCGDEAALQALPETAPEPDFKLLLVALLSGGHLAAVLLGLVAVGELLKSSGHDVQHLGPVSAFASTGAVGTPDFTGAPSGTGAGPVFIAWVYWTALTPEPHRAPWTTQKALETASSILAPARARSALLHVVAWSLLGAA